MKKSIFAVIAIYTTSICLASGNESCTQDKFWANEAISGNLMVEAMGNWRTSHPLAEKTQIAIVDSGVRKTYLPELKSQIKYYSLGAGLVLPDEAETTHGYSVASIYAAYFGLYQGGQIGIYSVSIPGSKGGIDAKIARDAYIDACARGYKIINASHGSDPNFYTPQDEVAFKDTIKILESKGCLIIKSAGNESARDRFLIKNADIDDGYLRVASTRFTGGLAEHSNIGEISAPGDQIYTLSYNPKGLCSDKKGQLSSGTSFAGPLVGAVAANVREILSVNSTYEKLSGEIQLAILNRVLSASSKDDAGMLDGLRAVKIAMSLEHFNYQPIPTIEVLREISFPEGVCAQQVHSGKIMEKLSLCNNLSTQDLDLAVTNIIKSKKYYLLGLWQNAVTGSKGNTYTLPPVFQKIEFWSLFFGSKINSNLVPEKKNLTELDITAIIDIYTKLRPYLRSFQEQIDILFVDLILRELSQVPPYIAQFPLAETGLNGFYSMTKAANEIGPLLIKKIADERLNTGLVTIFLEGKNSAFWSIIMFAPYKSVSLQQNLERLLKIKNAGNLSPNDLLRIGARGAVGNSYNWMKSVILSDRIFEAKHKSDIESTIALAEKNGNVSIAEKMELLNLVGLRLN
ncbi:MAG: S8 family serine peptidase [Deltaproteobacteria bacterium]|nr:S8 family serine peptidase [Deltaproteobacteria bacterium]